MEQENLDVSLEEKTKKEEPITTKTLDEIGLNFPIYTGNDDRSFSFKEWDMDLEEKIAGLYQAGKNTGVFVREMMDELLDTFEGKNWDSISSEEKLMKLHNISFPNMMYMYIALRVDEIDHELTFDSITCPFCGKLHKNFTVDLRTLDVITKNTKESLEKHYELKKPILINDKTITGFNITVAKWGAMEGGDMESMSNMATVKKSFFQSAIISTTCNGKPSEGFVDIKSIIRKLKKIDIQKLSKIITENNGGPEMTIGGTCEACKKEFIKPIEWGYDVFFDSSSL